MLHNLFFNVLQLLGSSLVGYGCLFTVKVIEILLLFNFSLKLYVSYLCDHT